MANSFQDQFLKAGLVDKKKVKQAKKSKYDKQRKQTSDEGDEAKRLAQQAMAEKAERDRELNARIKAEAEQKAIAAQVQQLIQSNRIEDTEGEVEYKFADDSVIKTVYLTPTVQQQLVRGQIGIARLGGDYALIPAAVAAKVAERDAAAIVLLNDKESDAVDEDDPYAGYEIPDDLMW
ncbi:MAG: DUF2058 domain-containing protein [Gammaproteobacteria bacterium]|nr:DUF2058 domain-containing protein [Gammaproteobacteria bacterium]